MRWGRGGRSGLGAISHASPPRRESAAHSPASGLTAGWGARVAGEGALAAHGGGEGRKLSKEGQKGWGRRNWLFVVVLLGFCFFVFSNKTFFGEHRFGEPPSPESTPTHPPSATSLSSRISGTGGRDAAVLGRAAMFPGAPEAHPSPTAAADQAPRGPWRPAVGARARTGTAEARRRGLGHPVWRGRGGPGTLDLLRSASPFALAICTARPLGDLAPGCPGLLGVQWL